MKTLCRRFCVTLNLFCPRGTRHTWVYGTHVRVATATHFPG